VTPVDKLAERARRRLAVLERRARDPRFLDVMGRFVHERLLVTNRKHRMHTNPLDISDVLWAGEREPRLLELLPALVVKRPAMFVDAKDLPADLGEVVRSLRRDAIPPDFRGIPGADVHRWLRRVGHRGKAPSRLKSFRFTPNDQRLLEQLSEKLGVSETEVVRRALRTLS
jgi:hypothetical protein